MATKRSRGAAAPHADEGSHPDFLRLRSAADRAAKRKLLSTPIVQVDPAKATSVDAMMRAFTGMSIQARALGECADIWERALRDRRRPTILLGLAGPLIAAGLRKTIATMVREGLVDAIVSTGAVLYQDVYQARGHDHWRGTPEADDVALRDLLIDRIYDTYVDEERFWETDVWMGKQADAMGGGIHSTRWYLERIGKLPELRRDKDSIVGQAARHGVPMFAPALADSSIGIGMTDHLHRARRAKRERLVLDTILDNYEITQLVVRSRGGTAAIYIGGGVPKNYINDSVVMAYVFNVETGGHRYAFQLTMDQPSTGGLSGSTISEARSWGKVSKVANFRQCQVDVSIGLPLLVTSMLARKAARGRGRLELNYVGEQLRPVQVVGARKGRSARAR